MCPNATAVVKLGTCCPHASDARLGDMIVMGAGANEQCLIDTDEMVDDHPLDRAAFEFPFLDELLIMQTVQEWQEDSAVLRMLDLSKSICP